MAKHYSRCETAMSRTCVCQMCGGSLHGWPDAIRMLDKPAERKDWWRRSTRRATAAWMPYRARSFRRPSQNHKLAAADLARVELLAWLAAEQKQQSQQPASTRDPSSEQVVDRMAKLGAFLNDPVLAELQQSDPGGGDRPKKQTLEQALADHFWCELLAVAAQVLAAGIKLADALPQWAIDRFSSTLHKDDRLPVPSSLVTIAARRVWVHLSQLFTSVEPRTVLFTIRLLAILICKAPEKHESVAKHCLEPLTGWMRRETREHVIEAFKEWMQDSAAGLPPPDHFASLSTLLPP